MASLEARERLVQLAGEMVDAVVPQTTPCVVKLDQATGETQVVYSWENLLVKLLIDLDQSVRFSCAGLVTEEAVFLVNECYSLVITAAEKDYPVDPLCTPEVFEGAVRSMERALAEAVAA